MKLPVALPPLTEHVETTKREAPLGPMFEVTEQVLSVRMSCLAVNEIVSPGEPKFGVSIR